MNGRNIEIVISDGDDSSRMPKKKTFFRRIVSFLVDNRLKGRPELENALRPRPEEHQKLKRGLNIAFIGIGVALFIAVMVVIIYTVVLENTTPKRKKNH